MESQERKFSGHIFLFYAFDVGEDISLEKVKNSIHVITRPLGVSKHFKNYHLPLEVELPHPHTSSRCESAKIHAFGAISLTYRIPFNDSLSAIRKQIEARYNQYREQSIADAHLIFKKIKRCIVQPRFFLHKSSYAAIQVDQDVGITPHLLRKDHGGSIASLLRFETEILSEERKNEILKASREYIRNDLVIIDIEAAFIYDEDYQELLDLFEFANIQQLELQYFDQLLDVHLNQVYEKKVTKLPLRSYLPFVGTLGDTIGELSKLRVDISVITERLENSINLSEEPYFSEIYDLLAIKLQLKRWKLSINSKMDIIKDIRTVYQNKIDLIREDMLSVLIIILIMIELVVAIMK